MDGLATRGEARLPRGQLIGARGDVVSLDELWTLLRATDVANNVMARRRGWGGVQPEAAAAEVADPLRREEGFGVLLGAWAGFSL